NKGIELGVSFPHIGYYDRAVAYQLLGRYKEAYYDYKKVLEIEPNFTQASDRLKDFVVTRVPVKFPGESRGLETAPAPAYALSHEPCRARQRRRGRTQGAL